MAWEPDLRMYFSQAGAGLITPPTEPSLVNYRHAMLAQSSNILHYSLRDEAKRSTGGSNFAICKWRR